MVNRDIISRLLGLLVQYLRELKEAQSVTWDAFSADIKMKRFVERTLQMCVEISLDCGNHIISDEGWREAETNRDIFIRLNEMQVVSDALLPDLLKMAGFRNRVVHDYSEIEPEIVFGILKKNLGDFENYIAGILHWMKKGNHAGE